MYLFIEKMALASKSSEVSVSLNFWNKNNNNQNLSLDKLAKAIQVTGIIYLLKPLTRYLCWNYNKYFYHKSHEHDAIAQWSE